MIAGTARLLQPVDPAHMIINPGDRPDDNDGWLSRMNRALMPDC